MKRLTQFFCYMAAAASLAACSDDKQGATPPAEYATISFETAEDMVDAAGKSVALRDVTIAGEWAGGDFSDVLCGKEYMDGENADGAFYDGLLFSTADGKVKFGSFFTDNGKSPYGAYDTWGGFVLSRNFSRKDNDGTPDYKHAGFSAWTTTAARGTATFAIAYDNGYGDYRYNTPKIVFAQPCRVAHLYLANATVAAQYRSKVADYRFRVVVTGFLGRAEGRSVTETLIEGSRAADDWVKVDLSSLGEVDELRFKVESNDMTGTYLNCPAYFCVDEITYVK